GVLPFTSIQEDNVSNNGNLVTDLIGGQVTDANSSPLLGIAITATDTSHGNWQYTTDGGTNWIDIGPVSPVASFLLPAGNNNRVRFIPNADYFGTSSITLRAWDQTQGVALTKVDTTTNGIGAAFSLAVLSSSITINP